MGVTSETIRRDLEYPDSQ
nr:hypothetical protein [Enterocloster clostridioformis]